MVQKVMWREAKLKIRAFAHVASNLSGDADTATCKLCGAVKSLEKPGRTRQGLFLELARRHFYKHKLDENFYEEKK